MSVGEIDIIDEREDGLPAEPGHAPLPDDYNFKDDRLFQELPRTRRVEILRIQDWATDAIAREVGITRGQVNSIVKNFDDRMRRLVSRSDEEVRGLIEEHYWRIVGGAAIRAETARESGEYRSMSFVGMAAIRDLRKMRGLDAPERSVNLSLSARTVISPDQQQALINDPEYRQHLLAIEELERRASQGQGHVPGSVRGGGLQGPVEGDAAPPDAQRADAQGGDGGDRPADGLHAAEARKIGIPVDVVPGVVSGDLPRSEGDLG